MENLLKKKITDILPHRKPFLFIDRVIAVEGTNKIIAEKKINEDEDYLRGHFPKNPILPGVLIIESMAQASGIISAYSSQAVQEVYFLSRVSDIKFTHPVFPGDTLIIKAEILGHFDRAVKTHAICEVNGRIVAEGELVLIKQEGAMK